MKKNYLNRKVKILVFFISLIIVVIVGFILFKYQIEKLKNDFDFNVKNIIKKDINAKIINIENILTSLSRYSQSNQEMTSSGFSIFTKDLLKQAPHVNNIMYSSIISQSDKISFETYMKDIGYYDFTIKSYDKDKKNLIESSLQDKYAPIILLEPSTYKFTKYIGYDIFNHELLHESFINSVKTTKIISSNVRLFNNNKELFFIKATYFGEDVPLLEVERIKNLKGFYIVNIDVEKMLKEYIELYRDYNVEIFSSPNIDKNHKKVKNTDEYVIEDFSYLIKLNPSSDKYLYVTRDVHLHDLHIKIILFILFILVLLHFLVVLIIEKNKFVKKELSYKATHDDLTGLSNRNHFKNIVNDIIDNYEVNSNEITAILFIDLDKFKDINDTLGHKFGDEVLIEISKRFKQVMRNSDTICRYGGDEFLIIVEDINSVEDIINIVRKIMDNISKPISFDQHKINLTISMGISLFPNDGKNVDDLLKNADSAMYKAKDEGRNTFKFYTENMTLEIMQKVQLEKRLREAIINDNFIVFFQPQYNAKIDEIIGMEALVRWEDENKTIISPADFIPMANETGLIIELDRLVMNKAMKQFSFWKSKGLEPKVLSLNLSMKHLKSDDFIEYLQQTILENNCTYDEIELEIIEDEIMENPLESISKLKQISSLGIRISVDDFGTGHSSLAYLKNLPLSKLKIDRAFIKDLPGDSFDIAISRTVIELAKNLNLDVIAEGVETVEQKDFLVKNGCNKIQGFYYSKPIPSNEMEVLLSKNKKDA